MRENNSRTTQQLDQLTSSLREMASRVNAEFVVDDKKSERYLAASETRDKKEDR